jgi:tRNA(Ile)-lysidine synthase
MGLIIHPTKCFMLDRFLQYIKKYSLIGPNQRTLLAVSGGIDSATMTYLFHMTSFDFAIAHCNFHLRGDASYNEGIFVQALADKLQKKFYTIDFDTAVYAEQHKLSIQMAARKLRYIWFSKIADEDGYEKIAVAHNRDDIVETFLINLTRGTGLKGLAGIKPLQGKIIRPLLYATREEIINYAIAEKIEFREDLSNNEIKYQRNFIRHKIIPLFKELNPSFGNTIIHETEIFQSTYNIYQIKLQKIKKAITLKDTYPVMLSIAKMRALRINVPLLFDLLFDYGFSYTVVNEIYSSLNAQSGKKFFSDQFILLKDRNTLIIEKKNTLSKTSIFIIESDFTKLDYPLKLSFLQVQNNKEFVIPQTVNSASIDCDKLEYPLHLRHWQRGDYFYPIGMKGRKKLSDFFIDCKINLFEKENIWILTSKDRIVWVVGYRIDDRYKVTPATINILLIAIDN